MVLRANKGTGNNTDRDSWRTPQELFDKLHLQYKFEFDCCASKENNKTFGWTDDFLIMDEMCLTSWMNPPFSKAKEMFEHYFKAIDKGVCIFRCDNMETKLWQDIILKNATWILIPNKRINYEGMSGHGAVFPSALIGYNVEPPKNIEGTIMNVQRRTD